MIRDRDIEATAKRGQAIIDALGTDAPEDLGMFEAIKLMNIARQRKDADALLDAITTAYYMGLAVGHDIASDEHATAY